MKITITDLDYDGISVVCEDIDYVLDSTIFTQTTDEDGLTRLTVQLSIKELEDLF